MHPKLKGGKGYKVKWLFFVKQNFVSWRFRKLHQTYTKSKRPSNNLTDLRIKKSHRGRVFMWPACLSFVLVCRVAERGRDSADSLGFTHALVSLTTSGQLQHFPSVPVARLLRCGLYRGQISVTEDLTLSMSSRFWSACIHYAFLPHVYSFLQSLHEQMFILGFTYIGVGLLDSSEWFWDDTVC